MSNSMVSPSSPSARPATLGAASEARGVFAAERGAELEALGPLAPPAVGPSSTAGYDPELGARELDRALVHLLEARRQTEWLLCRYLADIADERRFREIGYYSDILHYARDRLGLSVKSTRERLRIGRALRALPRVEHAFVAGRLGYSRVRELTRVATAEDEEHWLELALMLPMRELERRVASVVGAEAMTDAPAEIRWRTPETVELRMHLPAEAWALLSRAMQGAREAAETPMSDAEAVEAVAREALARLCERPEPAAATGDPRKAVVVYRCRLCGQSELETGAVPVPLAPAQADRLGCGAKLIDLETEGYAEACTGGTMPAAIRRAVLARDRARCRVCGRRRYVDVHHLVPKSQGGAHSRSNCVTLCTTCHTALHDGRLGAEGEADETLRWFDADGRELNARPAEKPPGEAAANASMASEPTAAAADPFVVDGTTLLRAMGGRGGWTADALTEATTLAAGRVAAALIVLQLEGRAASDGLGSFSPVSERRGEACGDRDQLAESMLARDVPTGALAPACDVRTTGSAQARLVRAGQGSDNRAIARETGSLRARLRSLDRG
jgi:hypothetical protein